MNNVLLGKTIKAMYKLSGKTLTQLSEETDLTVDTINNLFYARIQKPGLAGVNALVKAMGFSLQLLTTFLENNEDFPENGDITEAFVGFVSAAEDAPPSVSPAKVPVKPARNNLCAEIEILNAEHEKQLDRFRSTHQGYVERLKEQHSCQIEEMRSHNHQLEQHFEENIRNINEAHEHQIGRMEKEIDEMKKNNRVLSLVIGIETLLVLIALFFDVVNKGIGWIR